MMVVLCVLILSSELSSGNSEEYTALTCSKSELAHMYTEEMSSVTLKMQVGSTFLRNATANKAHYPV
jgi:hypothetical protein